MNNIIDARSFKPRRPKPSGCRYCGGEVMLTPSGSVKMHCDERCRRAVAKMRRAGVVVADAPPGVCRACRRPFGASSAVPVFCSSRCRRRWKVATQPYYSFRSKTKWPHDLAWLAGKVGVSAEDPACPRSRSSWRRPASSSRTSVSTARLERSAGPRRRVSIEPLNCGRRRRDPPPLRRLRWPLARPPRPRFPDRPRPRGLLGLRRALASHEAAPPAGGRPARVGGRAGPAGGATAVSRMNDQLTRGGAAHRARRLAPVYTV